jgi:hypothetical protein
MMSSGLACMENAMMGREISVAHQNGGPVSASQIENIRRVFAGKLKARGQWQPYHHSMTQQLKLLLMLRLRLEQMPEEELVEFLSREFLHLR